MEVQGRELRGQVNLVWNTDLIETMELEYLDGQASQGLYSGEAATNLEKLTLTKISLSAAMCNG